jgi:hypothetical protein
MTIHRHARRVAESELARRKLAGVKRSELEELAHSVAAGVADLLVETAQTDAAVARALESIYEGPRQGLLRPFVPAADPGL